MKTALEPTEDDLKAFVAASVAVGAAFFGYFGDITFGKAVFSLLLGVLVLGVRELGQRTLAQLMDAEVKLELSVQGTIVTLIGAAASVITSLPIILLFPVENSFDTKSYVQWGKSIDAVWMKRKYWIVLSGIIALLTGYGVAAFLNFSEIAIAFLLFLIFQIMPFDYRDIPTGCLDGAYILRWSGFTWLVVTGTTVLLLVTSM